MTGLIDVGGGMKCAYSAGLYDYFMDNGIKFDYYLGVSAGSMNLISYIAGERGRNIRMYRLAAEGNEYLSLSSLVHNGTYMNYEKVAEDFYSESGADPFDFDAFRNSDKPFVVAATRAKDAATIYFDRTDMRDRDSIIDILSASCCIPVASKPIVIDNVEYFDGGLAEPVPFRKAFDDGCDNIVVVLSSTAYERREKIPGTNIFGPAILKEYPAINDVVEDRPAVYNYMIRCIREYELKGRALLLSPEDIPGAFTLAKDIDTVNTLYENGYRDGEECRREILRLLGKQ